MARANGKACVHLNPGKYSFITVVDEAVRLVPGTSITDVRDKDNGIIFTLSRPVPANAHSNKVKIRIQAPVPLGFLAGASPDCGDLTITLSNPAIPVNDQPVDYVNDDLTP
jgi:hypothetical protein